MLNFRLRSLVKHIPCRKDRAFSSKVPALLDIFGVMTFGTICATTLALGVWQLNRYSQKTDLIHELELKFAEEPIDVNKSSDLTSCRRGQRIRVYGRFNHKDEVLLGPRTSPGIIGAVAQGLAINPQGFYVITPLELSDGTLIYVNRGWVSKPVATAGEWSRPLGSLIITAVPAEYEKKNYFSPLNDPKSKKLLWLEREALDLACDDRKQRAAVRGLVDVILTNDEVERRVKKVYPIAQNAAALLERLINVSPSTHLGYAATWLSLSVFGAFMTFTKFRIKRKR